MVGRTCPRKHQFSVSTDRLGRVPNYIFSVIWTINIYVKYRFHQSIPGRRSQVPADLPVALEPYNVIVFSV